MTPPTEYRVKIMRDGEVIGSIPGPRSAPTDYWQVPMGQRKAEPFASFRVADFKTQWFPVHNGWGMEVRLIADPALGDGDLEAIVGFRKGDQP